MVKIWHIIKGTVMNLLGIMPGYGRYRMDICRSCRNIRHGRVIGDYCSKCGCVLKSKVAVINESCPDEKW